MNTDNFNSSVINFGVLRPMVLRIDSYHLSGDRPRYEEIGTPTFYTYAESDYDTWVPEGLDNDGIHCFGTMVQSPIYEAVQVPMYAVSSYFDTSLYINRANAFIQVLSKPIYESLNDFIHGNNYRYIQHEITVIVDGYVYAWMTIVPAYAAESAIVFENLTKFVDQIMTGTWPFIIDRDQEESFTYTVSELLNGITSNGFINCTYSVNKASEFFTTKFSEFKQNKCWSWKTCSTKAAEALAIEARSELIESAHFSLYKNPNESDN